MLCALQMKYHPSLHANLNVVTGVPSCIREVLLCALGLLFNFLCSYLVEEAMLCALQMKYHPCFPLNWVSHACSCVTITWEVSLCVFGGLCVLWLLLCFLLCLMGVLCGLSSASCGLHPVWMISFVQFISCLGIGVMMLMLATLVERLKSSATILWKFNFSPTILHHPLNCFLWAAQPLFVVTQSDGTLSMRRVGCRSFGFGVY